jgi:hypothetical protein
MGSGRTTPACKLAWRFRLVIFDRPKAVMGGQILPQKSTDIDWNCLKIRGDFLGIDAKMRKSKKTGKGRKKALDAVSGRSAPLRPGKPPRKSTVALHTYDLAEPIEYQLYTASPVSPFEMAGPEKPKRGRRTVPNNFLLGSRNNWLSMFEENWAEIGFSLLEIRRRERSAIEDVRKAFDSFKGTDTGAFSKVFLQGTPQEVTGKEMRANRSFNSTFHRNIERMRSQQTDLMRSYVEVEHALEEPGYQHNEILQTQEKQIKGRLLQLKEDLRRAENELPQFDQQKRDQEAYWYCSQLLDFLHGKRRNAVKPLNLANALAGLPEMGWRESDARCSKMHRSSPCVGLSYRIVELVSRMWRRRPRDSQDPPIEFFRAQIRKLPKKDDGISGVVCRAWRDFRLAIEECWKESESEEFMPYAITSTFLRNHARSKTSAERILAEREMLS